MAESLVLFKQALWLKLPQPITSQQRRLKSLLPARLCPLQHPWLSPSLRRQSPHACL